MSQAINLSTVLKKKMSCSYHIYIYQHISTRNLNFVYQNINKCYNLNFFFGLKNMISLSLKNNNFA